MTFVVLELGAAHDDVVHVDSERNVQALQRNSKKTLERGRRVGKAHGEHIPLVELPKSCEGGLVAVVRVDRDVMKRRGEVDASVDDGVVEDVDAFVDGLHRVLVADGDLVEEAVVEDGTDGLVLLEHNEHGR